MPCVAADDRLIHQLVELVGRELDDARRLVGDGAWLMTGTGIVPPDDFTLEHGDEIRITIESVGTLTNTVA